jgi:hypothetical protein
MADSERETVALVFSNRENKRDLVGVAGPIDDISGEKRGVIFTVWRDSRGIRKALREAGVKTGFRESGDHVIYGRLVEEDKDGLTVAPIVYNQVSAKHNETGYEEDVAIRITASHIEAGRVLVARGVDIENLENGTAETAHAALTWSTYSHASQSETLNPKSGRGK